MFQILLLYYKYIIFSGVVINNLNKDIVPAVFTCLKKKRNFDIKHLLPSLINRRLNWRILQQNFKLPEEYYNYLLNTDDELNELIELIIIDCTTSTQKIKVSD